MTLASARRANTRRARRMLARAHNPQTVARHAVHRFLHDAPQASDQQPETTEQTEQRIRALCAKAKKIYQGRDSIIIESPPWFIFYRDRTVITMMHKDAKRRWY